MHHLSSLTLECGHCGTTVKSTARVCPACHAKRGVGVNAAGHMVSASEVPRYRRNLALLATGSVVTSLAGIWTIAVVLGIAAVLTMYQSRAVIFSNGREYWFR